MKKPVALLKEMQNLVNKYVKHHANDFEIDKDCIMGTYPESQSQSGIYYWYLRESGTQIMSIENLEWKETSDFISAEFWLSQALTIYQIDVKAQTLTPVSLAHMQNILSRAKSMDVRIKLSYIIRRLETCKGTNILPNEALYHAANAYDLTGPNYISKMVHDSRLTYDNAIETLSEIKLGLVS